MLSKSELISSRLRELGIETVGTIIEDNVNEGHFFVYVKVERNEDGKQVPSNAQLQRAHEDLTALPIHVEFLLSDAESHDIEAGLRATIMHSFSTSVRNIFLSREGRKCIIWLDPKGELDGQVFLEIEKKAQVYLANIDLEISSLLNISNENLPGKLVCLNVIRRLSPISLAELHHELIRRGFRVPSNEWLMHRLDAFRKSHDIVRISTARYVLTQSSLTKLGTSRTHNSPDISKMLAFNRMRA